ncbi:MAG: DUF6503 family protein [Polyangiales bacterium]
MLKRMRRKSMINGTARAVAVAAASLALLLAPTGELAADATDAKALVAKVVEEAGGVDALRKKANVEYTYLYRRGETGALDVSVERYVFDGEKSWARYDVYEGLNPGGKGPVVQGYDGRSTWQTVAGVKSSDADSLKKADFLRKTNFYWFAMTFKLLDPGLQYEYAGRRKVGDTTYELVKVTFDAGVGDVSDTYLLYINPNSWRVDQFLFTVLDFGKTEPLLMMVEYERVDGVLLPTKRRYTASDWSGQSTEDAKWTDEISVGIRFGNGFDESLFARPAH